MTSVFLSDLHTSKSIHFFKLLQYLKMVENVSFAVNIEGFLSRSLSPANQKYVSNLTVIK